MKADNLPVKDFLSDIRRGRIRLPRFQRKEVWSHQAIEDFLAAIISGSKPTGVLLFLEVAKGGDQFKTRRIEGAEKENEPCDRQLLDGQQRLTAIFRALVDNYENRTYYVRFESDGDGEYRLFSSNGGKKQLVESYPRQSRANSWIGDSREEYNRNLIPVKLLHPDAGEKADDWVDGQAIEDSRLAISLTRFITEIKGRLLDELLPYLTLDKDTALDVAIDVFMKINTSFVKLSPFDIAVALFEADAQESLQQHVDQLIGKVPRLEALEGEGKVGDLALKVSCLFQDKKPTYGNYGKLDMRQVDLDWGKLTKGLKWTVDTLDELKLWDQKRLPSAVPIRVLAALHQFMPMKGDDHANAMRLIHAYLWRSFVTDWYSRQANDRLFSDYEILMRALKNHDYRIPTNHADTVFSCALPEKDALLDESWPTSRGILKKAILAISLQRGACDVASNKAISFKNIGKRQYHHIFPENLFKNLGSILKYDENRAMNCMLIDDFTNQSWQDKWPGDYLRDRKIVGAFPKTVMTQRLESHHLPADILLSATKGSGKRLKTVYEKFLNKRAEMVLDAIKSLCEGDGMP
ncbi:MAG: DUF262 domain-containing protein [Gammaproteobacteria bacterium]|nr:DUF262 domain-containing protein [Gammaproteobacteria bacterium]